jgi:hypothetical protein
MHMECVSYMRVIEGKNCARTSISSLVMHAADGREKILNLMRLLFLVVVVVVVCHDDDDD